MIGVSVGQYECTRLLGEGSTGMVYLAVHRMLGTPRAVKVLRSEWKRHPDLVARFINEARAAAAIRHRNIIAVHDCGQLDNGDWYILLDYLEGSALTGFISSHGGPLAPRDVVHVLAEVANGLQAAHAHGIIHRDLKPDNIHLSTRNGDPRAATILDFGVAKLTERTGCPITVDGSLLGTPVYMAPEQLRGEPVGPAADVFSLGVIAYQMLSGGRLPYQHEADQREYYRLSPVELYERVSTGAPLDLRRYNPTIASAWIDAIRAALAPEPADRPASPRALAWMMAEATPGDGFSPSGAQLLGIYAKELLEVDSAAATLRAAGLIARDFDRDFDRGFDRCFDRSFDGAAAWVLDGSSREDSSEGLLDELTTGGTLPGDGLRYQMGRRIGAGGMAEVFEGELRGVEGVVRPIAIKRVRAEYSSDPAFATMFIAEARLAAQLAHPNLVDVITFDRDPRGIPFLVMEYVAGSTLSALMRRGAIPPAVALFVVSEMLRGLGYAHERGLVHRDLSPHNVLLSERGAVKVSDFGIAMALKSRDTRSPTLTGKPAYMSPEQAHALPLDARSDLFSAGIILWEMITGERLFVGTTPTEVLAHLQYSDIHSPRQLCPDVPADLETVVMRLLQRDRERRYATAEDALEALLACANVPRDGHGALVELLIARAVPQRASAVPLAAVPPDAAAPATLTALSLLPVMVQTPTKEVESWLARFLRAFSVRARSLAATAEEATEDQPETEICTDDDHHGSEGDASKLAPSEPNAAAGPALAAAPPRGPWQWRPLVVLAAAAGIVGTVMASSPAGGAEVRGASTREPTTGAPFDEQSSQESGWRTHELAPQAERQSATAASGRQASAYRSAGLEDLRSAALPAANEGVELALHPLGGEPPALWRQPAARDIFLPRPTEHTWQSAHSITARLIAFAPDQPEAPPAPRRVGSPASPGLRDESAAIASLTEQPLGEEPGHAYGTLIVTSRPWADVWIDGKRYGQTPVQLRLPVGSRRVRLTNRRINHFFTVSISAARPTVLERQL